MTTSTDDCGENSSQKQDPGAAGDFPGCAPGCDCREPAAGKVSQKIKVAISLVVVLAVVGIVVFKTTGAGQNPTIAVPQGGNAPFVTTTAGPVTSSADQQGGSGAPLSAIADLNRVAAKLNTVFLLIPSKNNARTTKETVDAVAAVERALNAKGLSTGIYTLQSASPDYPDLAAKVTAPGIAVLTKGGGIGFVSGGISETSVMQAYVASARTGGCCPPSGGKAAVPCN